MLKVKARLRDKSGASLIWAAFILLASVVILIGVFQVASTFVILAEAKNEVKAAGVAALQYNYLESTKGTWAATLNTADVKSHLESDSGLQADGSNEKKLNADNNEIFRIKDLSVSSAQNQGTKTSVQNGYAISCTVSRQIKFGSASFDVPIPVTVYVWYAPKAF